MKKFIYILILIVTIFLAVSNFDNLKNFLSIKSEEQKVIELKTKKEPLTKEELKFLLGNASIQSIKIGEKEYSYINKKVVAKNQQNVSEGEERKVLQLALFYLSVKEDPLFTSPEFEVKDFNNSISILEQEQTQLLTVAKKNTSIFPLTFLKTISDVFDKEKMFLTDTSLENAQNLLKTYTLTASAYKTDITSFTKGLEAKKAYLSEPDVIQLKVATNTEIMLADLKKMMENGSILESEAQKRTNCLNSGQNCSREIFFFKTPEITEIAKDKFSMLPLTILFPIHPDEPESFRKLYIIHSPCWGWGPDFSSPANPMYVDHSNAKLIIDAEGNYPKSLSLKLGNQNFYRKVDNTSNNINKSLSELGLRRVLQSETAGYLCRNLEYQPMSATIDAFIREYKDKPILGGLDAKIAKFENNFLNSATPADTDLITLSKIYSSVYKDLSSKNLNPELQNESLKRYLMINRQLLGFPKILNKSANEFSRLIQLHESQPDVFKEEGTFYAYVFPFKSYWNLLYFPFSPSFWRSDAHPEYIKKIVINSSFPINQKTFITYPEAQSIANPEEINRWSIEGYKYTLEKLPPTRIN
ncbi:MAG: hypothetical protein PHQ59_00030 [Candidatus Daviesbacteria bacterium]|nr:hypothetical protein [Candidatus Daviesbacteria bacterium]